MYNRHIESYVADSLKRYKAISCLGPRQSGKTTLVKKLFTDFRYISLENPDTRFFAQNDPRGFFANIKANVILDEIQKVPDLLSYLQEILDDQKDQREFVMTGSNSLQLSEKISQSLAGRSRILHIRGLLCYLLRIQKPEQLDTHPLRGFIFENWVISESVKKAFNKGQESPFYFWRDQHGHEIDLVEDLGTELKLNEIKSAATFHSEFCEGIHWLNALQNSSGGTVWYGGDQSFDFKDISVKSWTEM